MKTIHLIFNSIAGQSRTTTIFKKINYWANAQQNFVLKTYFTKYPKHATKIVEELTNNNDKQIIISLGGDGSLNDVINGINNFENTYIGILPYGSGNDFARALKIEAIDPILLMNAYINNEQSNKVDFLLLNDKYRVINSIGIGMYANTLETYNKMKHFKFSNKYRIACLKNVFTLKSYNYRFTTEKNNPPEQIDSICFTINNGSCAGGGLVFSPKAKVDDGLIDIAYIKKFNYLLTIPTLLSLVKGDIDKNRHYKSFNCKHIIIEMSDNPIAYDGILLEHQTKCDVRIVAKKLNILKFRM